MFALITRILSSVSETFLFKSEVLRRFCRFRFFSLAELSPYLRGDTELLSPPSFKRHENGIAYVFEKVIDRTLKGIYTESDRGFLYLRNTCPYGTFSPARPFVHVSHSCPLTD